MKDYVKLTPISIDVLASGMQINYNIYKKINNDYALLCKDVILTAELIDKLKASVSGKNIYVPEEYQRKILTDSSYILGNQRELEAYIGYPAIKEETSEMLDIVAATNIVPLDVTEDITSKLSEKLETIEHSLIIQCLNGVRNVDEYLYTHSANVAILNGLMGQWLGLDNDEIGVLIQIGLVHDVGKLRVASDILNKPGKLTVEEFAEMKKHSVYSYEMLLNSGVTKESILQAVRHHHEKVNGFGYPDGLRMEQIELYARITSISDVYDAMISRRVYKEAHSPFEILHQFSIGRFSDLDMEYIGVFLINMPSELKDKPAILSTGAVARVVYINPADYAHPIIELDGDVLVTNEEVYCVSMYFGKM